MKDSDFVNSLSWPKLTEWCSSCTRTRLVKLVLPREEKVLKEEMFKEVATEGIKKEVIVKLARKRAVMLRHKHLPRRGGEGQASRRRRMLAYQLKLIERQGLPLSRLLKKKDAMSQRGKEVKVKEEEEEVIVQKKEEKEEGSHHLPNPSLKC